MSYSIKEFKGVIPALITCFDAKEEFDEHRQREVVRKLLSKGVHGFYLTGSTGEAFLMSLEERKKVVEVVVDEVAGRVPVMVHVGAISTKLSIELAQHAYKCGADAVSSVPPFYWRFNNEHIYQYYKELTEATPLPMVIYNIPLAGVMGFELILKLATIEGVKGIKYTNHSHHEIMRIKSEIGSDFVVFSGADEMAMSGLASGADGIIGSFYNLIPELFISIYQAVQKGDLKEAIEKQSIANEIINFSLSRDYFSVMKNAMSWMGVDAGYCRRPFINYDKEEVAKLREQFIELKNAKNLQGVDFLGALTTEVNR
ncbi:dihydrodipicolinate synthase family protein [Bacillus sp. 1P02SD]|uniref:dihydrodipicolinate synthase family protein n=1 Tax=Bacillus sp. 1P02SD TaxID=3132264 RepID=UPI0039A373E9